MDKHIVSFSGGKDSTAMLIKMIENGMNVDEVVFADTTLEFPEMYEWIDKIEDYIGMKITRLSPKHSFDDWFYGVFTSGKLKGRVRGFPYVIGPCWWSRDAKYNILTKNMGCGNFIYIGIAYDEVKRSKAKQYKDKPNKYCFPLVDWKMSEQDCFDYLKNIGLEHPLSDFDRTGCWLCPKQKINSLRILFNKYPDLWKKLKKYEKDSPHGFRPNVSIDDLEIRFKNEI